MPILILFVAIVAIGLIFFLLRHDVATVHVAAGLRVLHHELVDGHEQSISRRPPRVLHDQHHELRADSEVQMRRHIVPQ